MCIKWTIVKDIRSVAPRVKICKPFFFFVFGTQKGGRAPRRSQRRPWKLGIRIVTTFILCKWDSWWACGLFSAMIKVVRVVDHVLAFCQWCNFYPNHSLRGRRLKGKGKGLLGSRETRGAREEGGRERNACQETIVFAIPPTNYVCKNNTTVND